jgi:hypothetical protein
LLFDDKRRLFLPRTGRVPFGNVAAASDLELRYLRTLAAVARRRSFTRAADDLHIAQQAVSQQIKSGRALARVTRRASKLTSTSRPPATPSGATSPAAAG